MATIGTLVAELSANSAAFKADLGKAQSALSSSAARMERTLGGVEKAFKGLQRSVGVLGGLMAAQFAGASIQGLLTMTDAYNVLQGRIKTATKETGDYIAVSRELSAIAKQTGTSLETNVEVFQRLALGAKDLGKSNQDVLKLVEVVNQLGAIGGASTQAMQAGLTQFGQAMSAGVVRAEEFNSIVENLPSLANRIAEGLGVSTGQLRKMVLDGKLLSRDVFEVLLKQSGEIKKDFEQLPNSLQRSMSSLGITFTEVLGKIDSATGATSALASTFQGLSKWLSENQNGLVKLVQVLGFLPQVAFKAALGIGSALTAIVSGFVASIMALINEALKGINFLLSRVSALRIPTLDGALKGVGGFAGGAASFGKASFDSIGNDWKGLWTPVAGGNASAVSSKALGKAVPISMGGSKKKKGKSEAEKEMDRLKAEAESIRERNRTIFEIEKEGMDRLNKLRSKNLVSLETYRREVERLNKEVLDAIKVPTEDITAATDAMLSPFRSFLDEMENGVKTSDDFNTRLSRAAEIFKETRTEAENYQIKLAELNELLISGDLDGETYFRAYEQLKNLEDDGKDAMSTLEQAVRRFGQTFEDTFIQSAMTGKFAIKDLAASVLEDVARMVLQLSVIRPASNALTGFLSSVGGKLVSGFVGGLLGGGAKSFLPPVALPNLTPRANGGPIMAGTPYLVGERGPELMIPGSSGTMIPNSQLSGEGGGAVVVHITNNFSLGVQQAVKAEVASMMPQIQQKTTEGVMTAIRRGGKAATAVGIRS